MTDEDDLPISKKRFSELDMFFHGCCAAIFLLLSMKLAIDERFWLAMFPSLFFFWLIAIAWNCSDEPRQASASKSGQS